MRVNFFRRGEAVKQPLPVVNLTAFVVVGLAALSYLLVSAIGTDTLAGKYSIAVQMPVTGGLFPGSQVTYRGVPVGSVDHIEITPGGVEADLSIKDGTKLPRATQAVVADRSPAGEQYLDFRPTGAGPPYLQPGDVVPASETARPPSLADLLGSIKRFSDSVNLNELRGVFDALSTALSGTGPALGAIIDHTAQLIGTLQDVAPQTIDLLRNGGRVLDTQARHNRDLRTFSHGLRLLAGTLRNDDPKTLRLIHSALTTARQVAPFIRQDAGTVGMLLVNLVTVGHVAAERVPGLNALLISLPGAVVALDDAVHGNHVAFGLVAATTHLCDYHTRYTPPWQPMTKPIRNAYCREAPEPLRLQRGAANAPRPPGDDTAGPPGAGGAARQQADSTSWMNALWAGAG